MSAIKRELARLEEENAKLKSENIRLGTALTIASDRLQRYISDSRARRTEIKANEN